MQCSKYLASDCPSDADGCVDDAVSGNNNRALSKHNAANSIDAIGIAIDSNTALS